MPKDDMNLPEVVYHYTSMDTLTKIVANHGQLWGTSIKYLNDVSERDYFIKMVKDRVPEYLKIHGSTDEDVFESLLGTNHRVVLNDPVHQAFVTSFCGDPDSLPQWRSYCHAGNGVSIGFRVDCLKRAEQEVKQETSNNRSLRFSPMQYIKESDFTTIDDAISACKIMALDAANKSDGIVSPHPVSDYFYILIEAWACTVKHPSFSQEKEYRLMTKGLSRTIDDLKYRACASTLIPYVIFNVPRWHSSVSKSEPNARDPLRGLMGRHEYIDRVVVGPTPNMDLSVQAVQSFFETMNMYVEVVPSGVPYRDMR